MKRRRSFVICRAMLAFLTIELFSFTTFSQTLDSFNPAAPNGSVSSVVLQPDGQIIAGGLFDSLGGQPRTAFGRVSSSGVTDPTFNVTLTGANLSVTAIAVQPDSRILLTGSFTSISGQPRNYVGRLDASGLVDSGFNPGSDFYSASLVIQDDDKILVGGHFTSFGGQAKTNLVRLNANGTLDQTFNAPALGLSVACLAIQADGKILAGGTFTNLAGQPCTNLARLTAAGTFDNSFHASATGGGVGQIIVQPDGRILVSASFTALDGQPQKYVGRLNSDGSLDSTFNPTPDYYVSGMSLQVDGKIVIGGGFTNIGGIARTSLARLNTNGTLDAGFNANLTASSLSCYVNCTPIQADGKVVFGGWFNTVNGQARQNLARLSNTDPATQTMTVTSSNITWLRGGTAPEFWRTTFEASSDGINWTRLGAGSRITGGWQLTGLSLPSQTTVRARGTVASGGHSTWFVESLSQPIISTQGTNFGFRGNQFGFLVDSRPGQVTVVESSSDTRTWAPVFTNATGSAVDFRDASSSALPRRFYRARFQ